MNKNEYETLSNQIWATRISRINAERRLVNKEAFFQVINIYYSCLTIIFSILAYVNNDQKLSLMTIFMTISTLVVILYLNGQNYLEHARKYRKNYTALQELEFKLKAVNDKNINAIKDIYEEYCKLLNSNSNHIPFDYYQTVYSSSEEYREERWKRIRKKYYWNWIWRYLLKGAILILPVILYVMCELV